MGTGAVATRAGDLDDVEDLVAEAALEGGCQVARPHHLPGVARGARGGGQLNRESEIPVLKYGYWAGKLSGSSKKPLLGLFSCSWAEVDLQWCREFAAGPYKSCTSA